MEKLKYLYLIGLLTALSGQTFAVESALEMEDAAPNLYGNPYLNVTLGPSWLDSTAKKRSGNTLHIKYKTGFAGSIALGYKSGPMRYQLSYITVKNDHDVFKFNGAETAKSGGAKLKAGMVEIFFNFGHESQFIQPYIGAGIGFAHITSQGTSVINGIRLYHDNDDNRLAWDGAAGLNINLEPRWDIQIEYKHLSARSATHSVGEHYDNDLANLGISYHFT